MDARRTIVEDKEKTKKGYKTIYIRKKSVVVLLLGADAQRTKINKTIHIDNRHFFRFFVIRLSYLFFKFSAFVL